MTFLTLKKKKKNIDFQLCPNCKNELKIVCLYCPYCGIKFKWGVIINEHKEI